MVEQNGQQLNRVFNALSDPTRRSLLRRLSGGEQRVSDLAVPFDMSLAAVSKHIQVLERAGLVKRRIDGRNHHCRLEPAALANAHQWLAFYEQYWNQRLDALERLFTFEQQTDNKE